MRSKESMHTQKSIDLVLFSVSSPILCGVYENLSLVDQKTYLCKTLDALTDLLSLFDEQKIGRIFYAKGPGSFTAIKLTHIFLQTLCITKEIELYSIDAFYFNNNAPIKAFGNQYFIKEEGEIVLRNFTQAQPQDFFLPSTIEVEDFSSENHPLYILPPV